MKKKKLSMSKVKKFLKPSEKISSTQDIPGYQSGGGKPRTLRS